MTVRWKPLIILSGVFLVIAVLGVIAIVYTLVPRGSGDILPLARAERKAGQFTNAEIHYKRALQTDRENPEIHEEFAGMFAEWAAQAQPEKKEILRSNYLAELETATKYGTTRKGPRRLLLAEAMAREEAVQSVHWARELLALEPENADAHFVMANEMLEEKGPNVPEIKRHLQALVTAKATKARIDWVKARLAEVVADDDAREQILAADRSLQLPADAGAADRMALVKLRALDLQTTANPADQGPRGKALQAETRALLGGQPMATARTVRLGLLLERVQKTLTHRSQNAEPDAKKAVAALVDSIEQDVESLFQKALDASNGPELSVYLTYSDHLRYREKRAKCLGVVDQALKSPLASRPINSDVVMGLHAIAIETALGDLDDKNRFEKASPHIQDLLRSSNARYQGLGHLFQGAIDLERSGVAVNASRVATGEEPAPSTIQPKLRVSALNHLKLAAAQLPEVAEAQARYGVALVLSQEQTLGRQYLQNAMRLGNLAAQYQVWAAWSMVQAGYPEEAEPIVAQLLADVTQGRQPRELEGTLHLLNAEIHQARKSPRDLNLALEEYLKSVAVGQRPTTAVQLRLIQIDVQLGNYDRALARIKELRKLDQGGPALEHLAVLTYQEKGDQAAARKALDSARAKYPESDELVGLDAALYAKEEKPKEADRVLAAYLAKHPENVSISLMRAQVLADLLDRTKEARELLSGLSERSDNSAPLMQLALLDMKQKDFDAVAKTIAKIRGRWKEAATGDVLDAQLALQKENIPAAIEHFKAALKKDPNNKLVQFWKAQLDLRTGDSKEAALTFESIVKEKPVKELDTNLSLATASESALANLALQTGDVDRAIKRFEELRTKSDKGTLRRSDRWQLAAAYAVKGQWPAAKREVASMLNNPNDAVSDDERVRGANFYRIHRDAEAASAQLDYVLGKNPTHPGAVVVRSYMLADSEKFPEAVELLRKSIAAVPKGEKAPAVFYLMLAATEKLAPPQADAPQRSLAVLDEGLSVQPDSMELVNAKYRILHVAKDAKAAVTFVEARAKDDPKGQFRRMLVEVYRDKKEYASAERVLRDLMKDKPKDLVLAANLVNLVSLQAVAAAARDDRELERTLNDKTASLVREYRAEFANDPAFLQADCDLAIRRGDSARAVAITQEMDKVAKNSPRGPLNRARLYMVQGRTREAVDAYSEALERNPRQPEVRLMLGQARLRLGEVDEAIHQAKLVLETDQDQPDALLLEAQALANQGGSEARKNDQRDQAIAVLSQAIERQPKFVGAYHQLAEIRMARRQRPEAVAVLKQGFAKNPDDATGLALLIQFLTENREPGAKASQTDLDGAKAIATAAGERDKVGNLSLAIAVGYHKAGQFELALPWAEKSASRLDAPAVHLNYGDLLLSIAENEKDSEGAKALFQKAVEQYDLVLKQQANSVEAINNKAWVLHSYLGDSQKALELTTGLLKRVDPSTLPAEFFDTIGTIQEATGRKREAEESYAKGLRKVPDHPVLNFHMGKMIAADRPRASKAGAYFEKALAGKDRLSASMRVDLDAQLKKK